MLRFTKSYNKKTFFFKQQPNQMELINGFLQSIFLLDNKVPSKENSYLNQKYLAFNQVTEEQLDFISMGVDLDKETLAVLIENIINSIRVVLLDNSSILISRATMRDIYRNCFVLIIPMNHLMLDGVSIEKFFPINSLTLEGVDVVTFFQILSNNYHHNASKLDFLNFFARHANQEGFLHMGQTQLFFSAMAQEIHIKFSERKFFISMDNKHATSIKIVEYFKVDEFMQDGKVHPTSAIAGLSFMIDVTKKQKIFNQELFIYAENKIATKLSNIFGGTWSDDYENGNSLMENYPSLNFVHNLLSKGYHFVTKRHNCNMSHPCASAKIKYPHYRPSLL